MNFGILTDYLWGNRAKFGYLFIAALILLFTCLGAREIWTQEHRWADIVSGMFYRHDFLHPYLGQNQYYDKPLLSYWAIAFLTQVSGSLTTWTLRLPSALAGLLAIWSIYRLGISIKNKNLGLLAGWLLLTTYYFLFWARTSSADMLNLAGSLFAVAWYFDKRDRATFLDYTVFFLILAVTSLCKGLGGAVIPIIAVLVDVWLQKSWKKHLRASVLLTTIPAIIVYLSPFLASTYFGGEAYGQSGLYLVYRENVLRYVHPFDHQGPIYLYVAYLPIYLLPWAFFFIPALIALKSRWHSLSTEAKWVAWTLLCLFIFFTLSGSRRSYYILPVVPYAILLTAEWILSAAILTKKQINAAIATVVSFVFLFIAIDMLPAWYYSHYGVNRFAVLLKDEANQIRPWDQWNIVLLDAESKVNFYLQLPPNVKDYLSGKMNPNKQITASLLQTLPILNQKPDNTIFISRKRYASLLQPYFVGYHLVELPPASTHLPFVQNHDMNAPIAFVPAAIL